MYDPESGQLLSGSFMDYFLPRADFIVEPRLLDHPVPTQTNPLGAKGVGEAGVTGSLPTLMNAVLDALAPAGVPREIIGRYYSEIGKAIGLPDVKARFASIGLDPVTSASPEQFAAFIRQEIAKWAPVVKASGAKAD